MSRKQNQLQGEEFIDLNVSPLFLHFCSYLLSTTLPSSNSESQK